MSLVPESDAATVLRAADGRVPGRRGRATREKLLECATGLLATTPYRDLKVTDITRDAGTSPATFYQYFVDIEAAVLAIAERTGEEGAALAHNLDGRSWKGAAGWQAAEELVDGFLDFWERHGPVMRVVWLLTEEGDHRFRKARASMLNAVTRALAAAIEDVQGDGKATTEPMAMAGSLVAMLANVAAHQSGFESWQIHIKDVRIAMTTLVYWAVTGPKVPKR